MKHLRIGFVAEPYEEEGASGMGYVVLELIKNFLAENKEDEFVIYSSRPFRKERLAPNAENKIIPRGLIGKMFWFWRNVNGDTDVLIFIAPLVPLIVSRKIKVVLVCQELASQKIRPRGLRNKIEAFLRDKVAMPIVLRRASVVVAASIATKIDLMKFYNIKEKNIRVIYDGFQDLNEFKEEAEKIDEKIEPYFFFVGKVKHRKNVHGIVGGFIKFLQKTNADCKLVIAGDYGGGYYENVVKRIKESGFADQIFFMGYAVRGRLYSFYKNALACVFPSINEGFGMPIIEAMSIGTPVITSNISSMPEVAGDAALLVNPLDDGEIAEAMERIFFDANLKDELIRKGIERAKLFSWQKAAREYLELARRLADGEATRGAYK